MISETDQQLLEEYLDRQVEPVEAQRLTRRLVLEPELAGALAALRAMRAVRLDVFGTLAPEPASVESFSRQVVLASRRQAMRGRFAYLTRIGGGIAACIAIGFASGWMGRGFGNSVGPAVSQVSQVGSADGRAHAAEGLPGFDRAAVQNAQFTGPFQVSVTDPEGHVLDVQKFDRIEDASAFADSLGRDTRRAPSNPASGDVQPVVYAGQF